MRHPSEPVVAGACSGWDNGDCEGSEHCPPRCPRFYDYDDRPMLVFPYREAAFGREALREMYAAFDPGEQTMGLPPSSSSELQAWLETLLTEGWNLVAIFGGSVVSHISVCPMDSDEPEIVVFVHPDFRNKGIGTEMLRQVIAYADARDHEALSLSVDPENSRAVTVYENIGFEIVCQELGVKMSLPLSRPIADRVQRPPAERSS